MDCSYYCGLLALVLCFYAKVGFQLSAGGVCTAAVPAAESHSRCNSPEVLLRAKRQLQYQPGGAETSNSSQTGFLDSGSRCSSPSVLLRA